MDTQMEIGFVSIAINDPSGPFGPSDFAIDSLSLQDTAPEPVTSLLMGGAILGLVVLRRRRAEWSPVGG